MTDAITDNKIAVNVEGIGGKNALSKAESSTQLADRRVRSLNTGIKPPYNPYRLASFLELNETLATGIRKKSRYEVGFGFELTPRTGLDVDDADDTQREVAQWFWYGPDSTWQTKARQTAEPATPEEVKELARQDYHLIGWCCLEILTDLEGRPIGLAYVPARTIRVRKPQSRFDQPRHPEDGTFVSSDNRGFASRGYVQIRNGRRRYFGEAGDRYRGLEVSLSPGGDGEPPDVRYQVDESNEDEQPIFVDRETGDVVEGSAESLETAPANELIYITNPSPLTDDYGVPDWISATRTISADEAAKDYNADFFDNDTIPRFAIKVKGGELTEESKRDLRQMLNGLRDESHRTVILEVDKFQTQLDEDVEIELEPLGQGISEEMSFEAFRTKNEHEIAKVLEMPPIKIGVTDSSNRSNSEQQDRDFALETIQPEQHKFSQRLYKTIHQTALGVSDWTVKYELRGADQPKEDAEVARRKIQAVNGAVPVNAGLEMVGLDPLPEDHPIDGNTTLIADVGGGAPSGQPAGEPSLEEQLPPEENKIGERDWAEVEAELTKDPIEQMQFSSSNLDEGLFDFETNELFLSFQRDGGQSSLYAYVDVPTSEWSALANASSHGSYHYDNIRMSYGYVEITNFHDRLPEGPSPGAGEEPEDIPL